MQDRPSEDQEKRCTFTPEVAQHSKGSVGGEDNGFVISTTLNPLFYGNDDEDGSSTILATFHFKHGRDLHHLSKALP